MPGLRLTERAYRPTVELPLTKMRQERSLGIVWNIFCFSGIFNFHVTKLLGIEDFATLQALDKLRFLVPGDDSDFWVSACGRHGIRREIGLFPPNCSDLWARCKPNFVETWLRCQDFPAEGATGNSKWA